MPKQINFKGLWIPEELLLDNKLNDKEKLIFSMIIFLSNNETYCTTSNQCFANRFSLSTNRVSKILSSLKDKKYIEVNFLYKEDSKEIAKRTIKPIVKYNNTPIGKNDNSSSYISQTPIGENDKDINNNIKNKNIYNNNFGTNNNRLKPKWQSYEQREYPDGFFEQFYANASFKT